MTVVGSVVMFIVHGIAMFSLFTKMNNSFNPNRIAPLVKHQARVKKLRL